MLLHRAILYPALPQAARRSTRAHHAAPAAVRRTEASSSTSSGSSTATLRVCTNTTCKRQGSRQILQLAKDLHLAGLEVDSTGCIGRCGSGPNLALGDIVVSHVSTPAALAKVLSVAGNYVVDDAILKATELRLAGNAAANRGDLDEAITLYDQAIALQPAHGIHLLHSNRSAALQSRGEHGAALQSAIDALEAAPADFVAAHVRKIDALFALERFAEAEAALEDAVAAVPTYTRTPEYKMIHSAIASATSKPAK
mmetsp:Transcript_7522/g.19304  ORF Transcript_7522/g.19304 Transcript_7522/m.19304 type:complete len:255 (+) Transcript_7522:123-887(+)|eukprot:jgi/Tetstr1/429234/TSEL_001897.t1